MDRDSGRRSNRDLPLLPKSQYCLIQDHTSNHIKDPYILHSGLPWVVSFDKQEGSGADTVEGFGRPSSRDETRKP